jgi:hypothetical protein
MASCDRIFKDAVAISNDVGVMIFSEYNCQGAMTELNADGDFPVTAQGKSFIVPENYKIRWYKQDRYVDYDPCLWGTSVDNVDHSIDIWTDFYGGSMHTNYNDITAVDVEHLGNRNNLLASSCVGIQDPPIHEFEPGITNQKCENFLDAYCGSADSYSREVCKHRKLCTQPDNSNPNGSTVICTVIYLICAVVIVAVLLLVFVKLYKLKKYWVKNKSRIQQNRGGQT